MGMYEVTIHGQIQIMAGLSPDLTAFGDLMRMAFDLI